MIFLYSGLHYIRCARMREKGKHIPHIDARAGPFNCFVLQEISGDANRPQPFLLLTSYVTALSYDQIHQAGGTMATIMLTIIAVRAAPCLSAELAFSFNFKNWYPLRE